MLIELLLGFRSVWLTRFLDSVVARSELSFSDQLSVDHVVLNLNNDTVESIWLINVELGLGSWVAKVGGTSNMDFEGVMLTEDTDKINDRTIEKSSDNAKGVQSCYVFKSRLQEYAQKVGIPTPVYQTLKEGPSHEPVFKSTVIVKDVRYDSLPGFFNRKAAEQSAAEIALSEIHKSGLMTENMPTVVDEENLHSYSFAGTIGHETGLCKNLLQEYAQKMNYAIPSYICTKSSSGATPFICTVEIGGIQYIGAAARTKKEAEIKAARTALLAIQSQSKAGIDGACQYTVLPGKRKVKELKAETECYSHNVFCRYAAPIMVDVEYTIANQATKNPEVKRLTNLVIGRMPIMLRSSRCVLSGKDDVELSKLGECPLDPGGYFIVKGTEKVILIQEQLSKNRIIIDTDTKGRVAASVTSSTHETKSKTVFFMDKGKIYLQLNQFNKPIPIMVILKAMGMESDQEIVQMVGRDPRYGDLLFPSIQECAFERIYTQQQALDFLDGKIGRSNPTNHGNKKTGLAKVILLDVFLAHVPLYEGNFRPRWIYAAVMLRRMLDAILNTDTFDDKDYLGNKRLELSGQMISLLFEDLFKSMNTHILELANRAYEKASRSSRLDFTHFLRQNNDITLGLDRSISTGNWDLKRFKMHRKGVSQVVSRLSYIAALGHMTRISPQFEKTRKVSGPRALHPSQWGMLCPCDTPEGEGCGLTKNLALLTHVTTDEEDGPLISLCYTLGVEDLALLSGEELHLPGSFLVMFNGLILGKHRQPKLFAGNMRKLRRRGKIGEFVSIFVNEEQLGIRTFDDFLRDGLVEYLDVNEENNALIALYECENDTDDSEKKKCDITHIEIEPLTLLGLSSTLISETNSCCSAQWGNKLWVILLTIRQVNYRYNFILLDKMLTTKRRSFLLGEVTDANVGYDKLGAGQNATVAVMSYSGYDIEDAIVMNKSSLDRGFGRCISMKKYLNCFPLPILSFVLYTVVKEIYGNGATDRIVKPRKDKENQRMQILDGDGIAAPGEIIRNNDIYVNKESPINTRERTGGPTGLKDEEYRKTPAVYKGPEGETCVVDRVILCSDASNKLCIKSIIRHTRRPELGDKFSSRHGQKGVCGTIVQQEDFPFSERGICPDLIMNPHGFPSRMTIGKMIELLGGKAGVSCGRFHYGSVFGEPGGHADKVEDISKTLVKHGFSYSGKDFLYSGITGFPLQAYIFMGPIYYQKLKHMYGEENEIGTDNGVCMIESDNKVGTRRISLSNLEISGLILVFNRISNVIDKMHARATGPRVMLTRQPTEGRSRDGGLRLGEMERDCLIAYGASMLIFERLMLSSDPYQVQVCSQCGLLGYYNYKLKTAFCSMCKNGKNISTIRLPYACKLLFQARTCIELQAMNVVPRLKLVEA
ncbi:hypothetical protein ZIOFF_066037 [Zingiber officinale]|uniref:DNA-directed RNA polymerase subunit beta n=1 Tax=Zingiber officinale TaxID=94328 RepID=A0A8J5K7D9_ZINOF|nr:hypothetical protein ZIOFF_066037 [Zingiber officinale]